MRVAANMYLKLFISINETPSCVSTLVMSTILVIEMQIASMNVDGGTYPELVWDG